MESKRPSCVAEKVSYRGAIPDEPEVKYNDTEIEVEI